jgi:hypothetical protein
MPPARRKHRRVPISPRSRRALSATETRNSASFLVNPHRLESGGFVARARDPGDRQRTVSQLGDKAELLLSQLATPHIDELGG